MVSLEEQAVTCSDLSAFLPQTWQGWAMLLVIVGYLVLREQIHRYIKKASR